MISRRLPLGMNGWGRKHLSLMRPHLVITGTAPATDVQGGGYDCSRQPLVSESFYHIS
jgi:hypothetical protein